MITLYVRIDQDIIYEDYDEYVQVLLQHSVHQVHERCWGIGKAKGSQNGCVVGQTHPLFCPA